MITLAALVAGLVPAAALGTGSGVVHRFVNLHTAKYPVGAVRG